MSDHSITIVDIEAREEEVVGLAQRVIQDLKKRGVLSRRYTPSTLGRTGYAPGPRFQDACVVEDPGLLTRSPNGVVAFIDRGVVTPGGNGIELRCSSCGASTQDEDGAYMDAVSAWYEGDEDAEFACPSCGVGRRAAEWDGPFTCGLGALGFVFSNWPPLRDDFVASVAALLGHRVRVVREHI